MLKKPILVTVSVFLILLISIVLLGTNLPEQLKQISVLRQGLSFDALSTDCPELEAIKPVLDTKQVFLFGETHASQTNYDLQLRYVKYLAQNHNVKYILIEVGFSTSQLFNLFLKTGDDKLLQQLFDTYNGTFLYTQETRDFIHQIKKLNDTLPENQKLYFVGIDAEQHAQSITLYLQTLYQKSTPPPKEIENYIFAINENSLACYSLDFLKSLYSSLFTQKEAFVQYLGENYEQFMFCVTNTMQYMHDRLLYTREQLLAQNFIKAYSLYPESGYFAQLGLYHLLREPLPDNMPSFVQEVSKSIPELEDKIFICTYRYSNSRYYNPLTGATNISDFMWPALFNPKNDTVFFSPQQTKQLKSIMQETTKPDRYGDCVILIRNSAAATIIESP